MPAHRKPAELRADNKPYRQRFELVPGERIVTPAPPKGLLAVTVQEWATFWESPLARYVAGADLGDLVRLFRLKDERERAYRGFRKERLVLGSKGQPVLNPLGAYVLQLDAELRQLSDRFGLSPKARAHLGIDLGKAKRTLEDVNRDLNDPDETENDPDLAAVELPARAGG